MTHTPANGKTILIVEDDADTREFLEMFLGSSGYTVRTASTGAAGLEAARSAPISAVLLDRRLPDLDGIALCSTLSAHLGPNIPILMITADYGADLEAAAQAAGAAGILHKPFTPPALLDRLAALLPA